MDGTATTPGTNLLFDVIPECIKLDKGNAELFHHLVAKGLFLCKQARPDIQMAIAFLSTQLLRRLRAASFTGFSLNSFMLNTNTQDIVHLKMKNDDNTWVCKAPSNTTHIL